MPDEDSDYIVDLDKEITESVSDPNPEFTRSAERLTEKMSPSGIEGAYAPTVEMNHVYDATFLADHLRSDTQVETDRANNRNGSTPLGGAEILNPGSVSARPQINKLLAKLRRVSIRRVLAVIGGNSGWTRIIQRPIVQIVLLAGVIVGFFVPFIPIFLGTTLRHALHGQAATNYLTLSLLAVQSVYTVATIFLLWFNAGLFRASQEQINRDRAAEIPIIYPSNFDIELEIVSPGESPTLRLKITNAFLTNVGGGAAFDVHIRVRYCGIDFEPMSETAVNITKLSGQVFAKREEPKKISDTSYKMISTDDEKFASMRNDLIKMVQANQLRRLGMSQIVGDSPTEPPNSNRSERFDSGILRLFIDYRHLQTADSMLAAAQNFKSLPQEQKIQLHFFRRPPASNSFECANWLNDGTR